MTFFRLDRVASGEAFEPLPDAASRWTGAHLRGPAVTALLARAVEQAIPQGSALMPARSTFDLHSPVPMEHCRTRARVVKRGRTLWLVESELLTGSGATERVAARCRAALVATAPEAPRDHRHTAGGVWAAPLPAECVAPPEDLKARSAQGRLYGSTRTPWSGSRAGHQNADRHMVWYFDGPIIDGETPTPYQFAARAADLGNFVINYGAEGLSYINADVTLSLARLPERGGVGVVSELRSAHAGVAVGTAVMFDGSGMCGTSTVTAVRHAKTQLAYG